MPDRLESMSVFVDVAEQGSFAVVAGKRGVSSQMVAKHIQGLEARLGVPLILRTTRRHTLTDHGRFYLERCRTILAEIDDAETQISYASATLTGVLKVNAPVTFGAYAVVPLLTAFLRQHPTLRCELDLSDDFVDPITDGYDAIFRIGSIAERRDIVALPLTPYRLVACASPAYLAARGIPDVPTSLTAHECIGFAYRDVAMRREWRFAKGGRIVPVRVDCRLIVNDWKAMHRAALEGFGIAVAREVVIADDVAAGRLRRVLPDYDVGVRPMHLLYPRNRRPANRATAFLDLVRKHMTE